MPSISIIAKENAIIQQLKAKLPYLKFVGSIDDMQKSLRNKIFKTPATFVTYAGRFLNDPDIENTFDEEFAVGWMINQFQISIIAKNFKGEEKSRKDDRGAYVIIDDVYNALNGKKLGLIKNKGVSIQSDNLIDIDISSNVVVAYQINLNWEFQQEDNESLIQKRRV